jgi:uncharacterized Zn-binding protein involved in type VI secretion
VHRLAIRQDALVEAGVDQRSEVGLAGPVVGEREGVDDEPAGGLRRQRRHGGVVEPAIGTAGEELVTVDQPWQGHGFGPERVDDVAIVDDVGTAAIAVAAAARQGDHVRPAEEDLEPVVVDAHPQPVADEPRRHGVEDPAEHEAARGGDGDHDLLAVLGAALRQGSERRALGVDAAAVAGVAAADQGIDEAAVVGEGVEVAGAAQQQRILERSLQMAVGGLDRAVLMGDAAVVAAGGHAVVVAKRGIADRPVFFDLRREVAERRREAVAAMLARRAAEGPERVLETRGERHEALAAEHDMGVLEAAESEAEVIEPVGQRYAGNGDAEGAHVGEVRQAEPAGLVDLAEDHLALGAVQRPPLADAPLQRPPDPGAEVGMPPQQLLEQSHRPQPWARLEQGDDFGVEDLRQRIGPPPAARDTLLRRRTRVMLDAVAGSRAEPGTGGGDGDRGGRAMRHEEPHLVIGHMAAGHAGSSEQGKHPHSPTGRDHHARRPRPAPGTSGPNLR